MSATHHLSQVQLSGLAQRMNDPAQGGFSARAFNPGAGSPPSHKLMVGMAEYGENGLSMPMSGERIGAFATKQADALRPEGRYLGGWRDPKTTLGSLDVSKAHSFMALGDAMSQAHRGGEEAIGAVGAAGSYLGELPVVSPRKLLGWAAGNVTPPLFQSPGGRWGTTSRQAPGLGTGRG